MDTVFFGGDKPTSSMLRDKSGTTLTNIYKLKQCGFHKASAVACFGFSDITRMRSRSLGFKNQGRLLSESFLQGFP